jgi:diguanylate cyclase (GGDEF)-like protein
LTGLVNRRRFSLELEVGYLRARKEQHALSMLMLDVDHFKKVNDEFGHLAGDLVLCSLARICESVTRSSDVLCRYGGEEFAFMLPDTDIEEAREVAERLMQRIHADEVTFDTDTIRYTASIGIAVLHEDDEDAVDLLRRTDRHLYAAKAAGRDTVYASTEPGAHLTLVKDA